MTEDTTIKDLIPRDGRYGASPAIEKLADKYRGEAAHVSEQLGPWVEHLAGDGELTPPQKHLLSELAHISLLREALLSELAKGGVVNGKGEVSALLSSTRMCIETGVKINRELMSTVTPSKPGEKPVNVSELWAKALTQPSKPDLRDDIPSEASANLTAGEFSPRVDAGNSAKAGETAACEASQEGEE
jgi:hypothetical protein